MKTFIEMFKAAHRVSTPLTAIKTFDPQSAIAMITDSFSTEDQALTPFCVWDSIRGLVGMNDKGAKAIAHACSLTETAAAMTVDLSVTLGAMYHAPKDAILFIHNPQLVWETDKKTIQGIWNLRSEYKANGNMAILLIGIGDLLPIELQQDILMLEEPLPTRAELREIVVKTFADASKNAEYKACKKGASVEVLKSAEDDLVGLGKFPADQATATCLDMKTGELDIDTLFSRKRDIVGQNRGLTYESNLPTLKDKYGVEAATKFGVRLMEGKYSPTVILRMDECEKQFAGNGTDSSGSMGKMMSEFLTWVNDRKIVCTMHLGVQGTSKSWLPFCIGGEYQRPVINYNVGAMEDKHVGEGSKFIRNANRTIDAISDGRVWLVATANSLNGLPPEFINRFQVGGIFFFDLPSDDERKGIMELKRQAYKLDAQDLPDMTNWTGRDIDSCARKADLLGISLVEAGEYIVPLMTSHREQIETLRKSADGRFLSATHEGTYEYSVPATAPQKAGTGRRFK